MFEDGDCEGAWDLLFVGELLPTYDREGRLFKWGVHVLKTFRQPLGNQELVLATAEELCWPEWFDDPLLIRRGMNPQSRFHNTTQDLNRRQKPNLIRFKGDGNRRIGWEYR